ncbi:MAG TPA: Asp-tRNA(Asn)/Glu-tRNA(Gln) amidotransferase subunit GatA [Euzebyales bacterium]|nr:Asp-tRNA(Asn)/Glu-tRNA(Gln) amidotransferase subunit GatA [Euzebyales bacterium]
MTAGRPTDPVAVDATSLLGMLDAGDVSAEQVVAAHLSRIAEHDGEVHAFLSVLDEQALDHARDIDRRRLAGEPVGPLAGVPVALKDVLCTRGVTTTCGSRMLADHRPPYDATVVTRLRDADAVLVGKANMDEFAMGSSTENSAFGVTRNPWDLGRVPGGSSGGSAAAVAAHFAPLGIGTDTGGSIRQPAALCGVVGVKPTYGRVSRYGLIAFASSLDQVGPFARSVTDAARLYTAIAGHDPRDSTSIPEDVPRLAATLEDGVEALRVGVVSEALDEGVERGVAARVREAAQLLGKLGADVVDVSLPHARYGIAAYYLIAPSEASSNLARYDGVRYGLRVDGDTTEAMMAATRSAGFGPEVVRRIMIGTYALSAGYYDAYYVSAQRVRTLIIRDYEAAFERCDVVLSPTSPSTAFEIGAKTDDPLAMYLNDVFTVPASLAGMPALSMPAGLDDSGLPVGVQLVAPLLDEAVLFRAARALEAELAFDPVPRGANALHAPAAVRTKT